MFYPKFDNTFEVNTLFTPMTNYVDEAYLDINVHALHRSFSNEQTIQNHIFQFNITFIQEAQLFQLIESCL